MRLRKKLIGILCVSFLLVAIGCSAGSADNSNSSDQQTIPKGEENVVTPTGEELSKKETDNILVAYFSITGNTENIASHISGVVGGDYYKIESEIPYASEDINYRDNSSRANREQNDDTERPAIKDNIESITEYDIIFLGYPIWHGQAPKIMYTFLESHDFAGKTIIPFTTSGSSGIGSSAANMQPYASEANWLEGRRFSGSANAEEVAEWVNGFDLNLNHSVSEFNLASGENGRAPKVRLNSGYEMPIAGIGTYSLQGDECVNSITSALQSGVRLIDTAYMYHNEAEVGKAVRESDIPREEIFVITKLYPSQFNNAEAAIDEALEKLDIGYIDMMLLHHPGSNDVEAYKAVEKAVEDGKVRSIGLSNWYIKEIDEFLPQITVMPALIQNEIHPYYQENDVIPYMHEKGFVMQGWYPLDGRGYTKEMLSDETIVEIAEAHERSAAQVILRWNLQKGVVVIPGSSNPDHIKENISIFDFELTDEEMDRINALDRNEKHDWY